MRRDRGCRTKEPKPCCSSISPALWESILDSSENRSRWWCWVLAGDPELWGPIQNSSLWGEPRCTSAIGTVCCRTLSSLGMDHCLKQNKPEFSTFKTFGCVPYVGKIRRVYSSLTWFFGTSSETVIQCPCIFVQTTDELSFSRFFVEFRNAYEFWPLQQRDTLLDLEAKLYTNWKNLQGDCSRKHQ